MHKNTILYGKLTNGLQIKVLETLSRIILDYCRAYPVCLEYGSAADYTAFFNLKTLMLPVSSANPCSVPPR